MPRSKIRSESDFLRSTVQGLRLAATRPNINGYTPHDKQIDFHTSNARGRLFIGGNRSGKTVGGATEAVWRATGRHPYLSVPPPPTRGRIVGVDFKYGVEKIVRPEVARWLPASELLGGSWETAYSKEFRTLTLENGSEVEFMSYDQDLDKFAGTSRHWVWFDEEPPEDIFTECKLRLLDTGGDWWITMTPVEGMTWIYDQIYLAAQIDPLLHVTEVDTSENPTLNKGEIEVVLSGLDEDSRQARLHGKFVRRGGLIYPHFDSTRNIISPRPALYFKDKGWLDFAMMDHGFNNPTAWLWGACSPDGDIVIYDEHRMSKMIVKQHAEIVLQKEYKHQVIPDYRVGDPSIKNTDPITGTSVLMEYIENGVVIMLGNNDVNAGIQVVARRLGDESTRPSLYICSNCTETLWEMSRYHWATWANKRDETQKNAKEEPHKKDDHCMDALRYGCASRPLIEDGGIPENPAGPPHNPPVDPYSKPSLVDAGAKSRPREQVYDEQLGTEW
jgi:phage terminase large subunit-like protein